MILLIFIHIKFVAISKALLTLNIQYQGLMNGFTIMVLAINSQKSYPATSMVMGIIYPFHLNMRVSAGIRNGFRQGIDWIVCYRDFLLEDYFVKR